MAEELRFFLRIALFVAVLAVVYWFVSYEPAGTVLLIALGIAIAAFLVVVVALVPRAAAGMRATEGGPLRRVASTVNRVIGFHERPDASPPLEGGPDLVPLGSPWPIVTAAAMVVIGLGLIFGAWLTVPGVALLVLGGIGWLTQLDRA